MLSKIAIWYLRKRKASVMINHRVSGGAVQQLTNHSMVYDCEFRKDVKYFLPDGTEFNIPEGLFYSKSRL